MVHEIKKLDINPFTKIAVTEAETMGLLNGLCVQSFGAEVILTEISEKKIENSGFKVVNSKEPMQLKKL